MNIASADPTAPLPQPPSSGCVRHPTEQFTGFCPSCLFDRLATLDSSSSAAAPSSRRPSSAIKSLFSAASSRPNNFPPHPPPPAIPKPPKPAASSLPELRRTKSFSASKDETPCVSVEPHRKSCDVRANKTPRPLFPPNDDGQKNPNSDNPIDPIESCSAANDPVLGEIEIAQVFKNPTANIDGIRSVQETHLGISIASEIVKERENSSRLNNLAKPMKGHSDLAGGKKSSGGVLWAAASVFTKKWHNWRHKKKSRKHGKSPTEKPLPREYRETQSEVADYGHGRRSVDVDPRFSLDAGRYSFDEPRPSWDGHLTGKRIGAPMVSVSEDTRADMLMPLAELNFINGSESLPGGSAQTRDYYLDSSSKRRKSVEMDRSTSIRKMAAAVVAEIDELKMDVSNAKTVRDSYSNSLNDDDDILETLEMSYMSNRYRDVTVNSMEEKKEKKSKKWGWKIWGFMHRKNHKDEDSNDRSLSQSWQETRGESGRNSIGRSNSSVSWRHGNPLESGRRSNVEVYGNGKKRSGEFVSDKNRNNVRYSPNNLDNGLLRFYLTPHRSNHRKGGTGKVKPTNSNPVGRNGARMY